MKNVFLTSLIVLITTSLFAQDISNSLQPFNHVTIARSVKLILKQGNTPSISAPDEETLNSVQYRQNDNTLVFMGSSNTAVTITTNELVQVDITGTGSISNSEPFKTGKIEFNIAGVGETNLILDANEINYNVSGNCTGTLSGKVNVMELNVAGRLKLSADSLIISKLSANVTGLANFKGDIRDELNTNIMGKSNIYYLTRPTVVNTNNMGAARIGSSVTESTTVSDTTKLTFGNKKVWIIGDEEPMVNVNFDFEKTRFNWAGFEFGWNNYVDADNKFDLPAGYEPLELNTGKSVMVNLNLIDGAVNLGNRHFMLGTGFGFSFLNYRFTTQDNLLIPNADSVSFYNSGEQGFGKYKLAVDYISVPVLFQINTSKLNHNNFFVNFGVVNNVKIGSRVKLKEGNDKTHIHDEYNLNPWKIDLRAGIGFKNFQAFATYGLTNVFKGNNGPELKPVSFGIALSGW